MIHTDIHSGRITYISFFFFKEKEIAQDREILCSVYHLSSQGNFTGLHSSRDTGTDTAQVQNTSVSVRVHHVTLGDCYLFILFRIFFLNLNLKLII